MHNTGEIEGTPKGTMYAKPTVSQGDADYVKGHPNMQGPHILLDPNNHLVRFFDSSGQTGNFPLDKFKTVSAQ